MAVFLLTLSLLLYHQAAIITEGATVSPSRSAVYGPGINPQMYTLPVQYFYTQLKDEQGNNYTGVIDTNLFSVNFNSPIVQRVFVYAQSHYLSQGLFVTRYRLHREEKDLTISVNYNGVNIDKSPYYIGTVITDKCYCPSRTLTQWLTDFQCPSHYNQINDDLSIYYNDGIDLTQLENRLKRDYPHTHGVHYSIINNKLYGKTFGTITDFRFMSDLILTSLINKVHLPDMEFIVQVSDWPQDKNTSSSPPFPFFSWCGSEYYRDIVWPQYDLMRHTVQAMDRVQLDMLWLQSAVSIPWDDRIPKVFFRGRDSNKVRLEFVKKYRKNTELFNVTLTQFFFHEYNEELYGKLVNRISFLEFFKYKYQINIDGTVAAYRLPFLLAGGSLIFKQDSQYYEHFYHQLKPWVHYIPLREDVTDIEEKLQWAIDHDDQAREIADNARQFAVDHLLPDRLFCYMFTLLKEYSKLQRGVPKIHQGMKEVTTDEIKGPPCQLCSLTPHSRDEL